MIPCNAMWLQYKKNNSSLTKRQKYSQIAKGMWTNRNTTYASQSDKYTDPNTKSMKRVNYSTITSTGIPINSPVTCIPPITIPNYSLLPINTGPGPGPTPPPLPPIPPQTNPNPILIPNNQPQSIISPIVIEDGGNLICTTTANRCTGEIISITVNNPCNKTSDSDVPGPIIELCYNKELPTFYPRQNLLQASAGGNKFPEGYKGFVSALHYK